MNEQGRQRLAIHRDTREEGLICPKPRRVAFGVYSAADMPKPARRLLSQTFSISEADAGCEILDILSSKGDLANPRSPPSHLCGLPPSRASNPLIHDVRFSQTRGPPPPLILPHNSSRGFLFGANLSYKNSSCSASYTANPFVRVEGFATSGSDTHRGVPSLA